MDRTSAHGWETKCHARAVQTVLLNRGEVAEVLSLSHNKNTSIMRAAQPSHKGAAAGGMLGVESRHSASRWAPGGCQQRKGGGNCDTIRGGTTDKMGDEADWEHHCR